MVEVSSGCFAATLPICCTIVVPKSLSSRSSMSRWKLTTCKTVNWTNHSSTRFECTCAYRNMVYTIVITSISVGPADICCFALSSFTTFADWKVRKTSLNKFLSAYIDLHLPSPWPWIKVTCTHTHEWFYMTRWGFKLALHWPTAYTANSPT